MEFMQSESSQIRITKQRDKDRLQLIMQGVRKWPLKALS